MKKTGLDFIIAKITNSIELVATGESFDTVVTRLFWKDRVQITNKEWQFKWHTELKEEDHEVYKLTTTNNPTVIHGLLSISEKSDHMFMNLIENAKFNKGRAKVLMEWRPIWLFIHASALLKEDTRVFWLLMLKQYS